MLKGVDQQPNILEAEFTKAVAPETGTFTIRLDNNSGEYTGTYTAGDAVEMRYDLTGGATTARFKGFIEEVKKVTSDSTGEILEIRGMHVSGELLDINVSETYDGTATADAILKDLVTKYFSSFTTTNVLASAIMPKISWNLIPFWDAVSKIAEMASFDLYADDDKDFHFFPKESIPNENEAIVYGDNLLSIEGLGTDSAEVKNRIIVQGEDDEGLPVVYTHNILSSQTAYRVKEKPLINTDIRTILEAQDLAVSEANSVPAELGKAETLLLATLNPGDMVFVRNPENAIGPARYRIARFTHRLPMERTVSEVEAVRTLANLFRDRIRKETALENVQNPHKLNFSYNLTFDSASEMDAVASSNVTLSGGEIYPSSGTSATYISSSKTAADNVTTVYLLAVGEDLPNAAFSVSSDDGNTWEAAARSTKVNLTVNGKLLRLRIVMSSANVRIKSVAILYS